MENKKYAPLIGQKLTWEMLEFLMSSMQKDAKVKSAPRKKKKKLKIAIPVHTEDDGA